MVGFPFAESINFFTAQTKHIGQPMRRSADMTEVCFIYDTAPIGHDQNAAPLDKTASKGKFQKVPPDKHVKKERRQGSTISPAALIT